MDGISQLWSEYKSEAQDTIAENIFDDEINDRKAYAGLEWWDEVSEDGSHTSLSQMLADEEYEETMEEEVETPMTFEKFAEETEKLIEQAEDERKETEAIMNAPPNANFLEAGEDDADISAVEKSIVESDKFQEMVLSLAEANEEEENAEEIISDEEIGVLEMDDFPDDGEGTEFDIGSDGKDLQADSVLESTPELETNVETINAGED
jgi:hypothetical protein